VQEFHTECTAQRIMHPDREVCAALYRCFELWRDEWGDPEKFAEFADGEGEAEEDEEQQQ
jgi:hypothetical protein